MRTRETALIRPVESKIVVLRGQKVILDFDLAQLYRVEVRQLNQQVKRNVRRFPKDFLFQLSAKEFDELRSQNVISTPARGGRRYLPYAFTEHGAIMAATVLNSDRAIEMSTFVVRAFVRLREAVASSQKVMAKLDELERRLHTHDSEIQQLIEAIQEMMIPPEPKRRRIGFETPPATQKVLTGSRRKAS